MSTNTAADLPTRFGLLLVNDFTLISMSAAIETLRMANRLSGKSVYRWKLLSETGAAVAASDGVSVNVDSSIEDEDAKPLTDDAAAREAVRFPLTEAQMETWVAAQMDPDAAGPHHASNVVRIDL